MKYKEFRMIFFLACMFVLITGACIFFALDHNKSKVIIGLILLFVLLSMIVTKYNMKIFNDSMMIYEYKGIGILPALIDYKDIKDVELISKHKIKVKHRSVSTLYILNAQEFYNELIEKMNEYNNQMAKVDK
ncbi:MAG: hypothetical protein KHX14_06540 [[Clostridium] spiroforme]|uniref:Uncharacterized protein n=1 Tax=Thomasclavelia spiroformis TaxID=29348 RepID=A0A943I6F1_9FIRM|nr:hypothetical protein [Thomasclavelia spiroformis]MBS5588460.1 hypothetical protein [Thomasclavelia spiroformis]